MGFLESAIKIAKHYLYPSQYLFACRTRGAVPSSEAKLAAKLRQGTWEKVHRQTQIQMHQSGKRSSLTILRKEEPVLVQDLRARKTQWMRGRCEGLSKNSYTVEVDGQLLHRNRQFLKPSWNSLPMDLGGQEQVGPVIRPVQGDSYSSGRNAQASRPSAIHSCTQHTRTQ